LDAGLAEQVLAEPVLALVEVLVGQVLGELVLALDAGLAEPVLVEPVLALVEVLALQVLGELVPVLVELVHVMV